MHLQGTGKPVLMLASTALTAGATQTARIDTLGYAFLTLNVHKTTANVVSNKFTTLKLSEGTDTNSTNATDITKFVGGGAGGFTIPSEDTSNPQVIKFNVDLRGRKRYIYFTGSPLTTQTVTIFAELARGAGAGTATLQGVGALIEG